MKNKWNTPSITDLNLCETKEGFCPAKNATCKYFCPVCKGCTAEFLVYDRCAFRLGAPEGIEISRCTCSQSQS